MALEAGRLIELTDAFETVYRAPRGPWGQRIGFSGGSRFDREFMIRIDQGLATDLERALHQGDEKRGASSP
jgi:hypothetical protein